MMNLSKEFKGMLVLIVDDEPDNIAVAKSILTFMGTVVVTAKDGIEALDRLKEISPDLILLDISMPHMDGWEALKAIRKLQHNATVPVVALTAHAMPGDREAIGKAGFDYYIAKPFRLDSFISDIRRFIGKSGAALSA